LRLKTGIVFNTSMTGVTELITDPASAGQIVVLTYPMIGNPGVCYEDFQSERPQIAALVVSELSEIPSNFRSEESLKAVLERFGIPVFTGVDTRSLVRLLRDGLDVTDRLCLPEPPKQPRYQSKRRTVSADKPIATAAVPDTGMRRDLERALLNLGVSLEVFPYGEIPDGDFDGFLLPDGPGDPSEYDIEPIRRIIRQGKPVFAVGLGHQLLALANGCKTVPLSPGHRGMNIPVRDCKTGNVLITTQNHGYCVSDTSADPSLVSHISVNDGTVEGLRWREDVFSVQFKPEPEHIRAFVNLLKR
jgi:carbamoyl-phosphate synthase small subunit